MRGREESDVDSLPRFARCTDGVEVNVFSKDLARMPFSSNPISQRRDVSPRRRALRPGCAQLLTGSLV